MLLSSNGRTPPSQGENPGSVPGSRANYAHVTLRATNADKGNWMEDAGSNPAVSAIYAPVV